MKVKDITCNNEPGLSYEDISVVVLPLNKDIPTGDNVGWGQKVEGQNTGGAKGGGPKDQGQRT